MGDNDVSPQFCRYCDSAGRGLPGGFRQVGQILVWHVIEHDCSLQGLIELAGLLRRRDDAAVLRWLWGHYGKYLLLVPLQKYDGLLQGIYACAERLELYVLPQRLELEAEILEAKCIKPFAGQARSGFAWLRPSVN